VPTNLYDLTPASELDIMMQARARLDDHVLPFGPLLPVHSQPGDPEIVITFIKGSNHTQVQMNFELRSGKVPSSYTVQSKSSLNNLTWTAETTATFQSLGNK